MYLLVKETGKYWRMNYRLLGKRKTLRLAFIRMYSLPPRASGATNPRRLLAEGIDPSQAKRDDRNTRTAAAVQTFFRR